ncbi:Hypothetical protein PHPALM_17335 [Phytophthora palmivora]|uniref:FAR1 domain-containing protein n=1 Tax=Phytophthora palmivora TaxID=4796 RepID=A0A2P4XMG8_9STRA|nr:Hypothetical protein PHPALM_17335 [Phytophthora palmivora]
MFQIFRTRSNTNVGERNTRIGRARSTAKNPASWVQYSRIFVCTHAGKYKSEATSKRPRQETRAKGCKAQINACVQVVDKQQKTFAVRITRCQLKHNHRLTSQIYKSHPSNRIVLDDPQLRTVDMLRKHGIKKSGILKHLMEYTESNPNPKDVQNLVRKLKAREQRDRPSSSDKQLKSGRSNSETLVGTSVGFA